MTLRILWHQPQRASPQLCIRHFLALWSGSCISLFCRIGPLPFCFRMVLLAPPWSIVEWKLNGSRYQALISFLWLYWGDCPILEDLLKHLNILKTKIFIEIRHMHTLQFIYIKKSRWPIWIICESNPIYDLKTKLIITCWRYWTCFLRTNFLNQIHRYRPTLIPDLFKKIIIKSF